ncbi:hypothetical protein ISCGN_020305 [Ixodes scapularis]
MVSIEVDGESISPEEITEEAGWLTSHRRRGARALAQLGLTPGHTHDQEGAGSRPTYRQPRAEKQIIRKPRLPRQPPLPKEDIKIVLRPREGLDITKISHAELRDGVLRATGLGYDEAAEDLLRINPAKNIIVASTPSMEHASKYTAVKELRYGEKSYNVTAYAAPPEDTVKGIIHDIPEYDSAEDITRSLIYKKNSTILQARRMGRTNSAIIVFEGTKVPYYVYYRGAEYRCFIHKKRHEVCDGCGRLGHRTDVCPAPDKKICKICGTEVPSESHQCEPKCALCGRDHPTGDKKCRLRFQTPYLLKKRKWEKQQIQNNRRRPQKGSGNPASTPSILKKDEPSGDTPGQRGRSDSFPRLPQYERQSRWDVSRGPGTRDSSASSQHRSRSSSRRRSPSIQGRQNQRRKSRSPSRNGRQLTGGNQTNKLSWVNTVSHGKTSHKRGAPPKGGPSSEHPDQQSEITKIRQMLELVISENKKLKAELAQLKGTSADSTPPPSPCNLGQAAKKSGQPNQLAMPPKQSPQTPSENGSADAMDDSPLDSPPSKRRAKEDQQLHGRQRSLSAHHDWLSTKLSTQDVMLRLRYDVIDGAHCSPLDTRAILGLDLTKAFDNVKHSAILANLGKLGLERRVYDYISNFLSDRTATLSIGGLQSDAMELGSRGTPQGSVLFPFLFNVAMIGLPKILNQIEGLQHTLYADDVTLWVPGGSDGHIQDTLQQAIEAVEQYIGPRGLSCAPQKSELLLYRPTSRGRRTDPTPPNVTLFAVLLIIKTGSMYLFIDRPGQSTSGAKNTSAKSLS